MTKRYKKKFIEYYGKIFSQKKTYNNKIIAEKNVTKQNIAKILWHKIIVKNYSKKV